MMHNRHTTSSPARDQLVAFLDSHLGVPYRDDVGPLFGEAAMMRDSVAFSAALAMDIESSPRTENGRTENGGAAKSGKSSS